MFLCPLILTVSSALSRSDKKVLHVDKNPYYGGAEAAFSLQEAEAWANKVNQGKSAFIHISHANFNDID